MKYLHILFLLFFSTLLSAQVAINTQNPFASSDFDIENLVVGGDTIPKGILVPKLTEKQRDEIDVSSAEANSLLIYNIDNDCYNYYSKKESMWISLCGSMGLAKISPITCNDIKVVGTYIEGVSINTTNYLELTLNIIKEGVFSVSGITQNGYYFSTQKTAFSKGPLTVKVTGYGVPTKKQTDDIVLSGRGFLTTSLTCPSKINVLEPIANYSINCNNIVVNGTYLKKTPLTASEYIDISVNVASAGSYFISTTEKNGIIFSASGSFTDTGAQTVRLKGSGTPTVNFNFDVNITSNSGAGQTMCTAQIQPILPTMSYAVIGLTTDNRSWNSAPRTTVLTDASNFSRTGIVKINGFNKLWGTDNSASAVTYLNSGFNGKYPDVVLFYSQGIAQNASLGAALASYIAKGGFVVYGTTDADVTNTNLILSSIFGSATKAQAQIAGTVAANNVYDIIQNPQDPIISGPFGSLLNNGYWGENSTSTNSVIVPALPKNSVQLVAASNFTGKQTVNPIYSIVWYSRKSNFVYFGSTVGASAADDGVTKNPAYYLNNKPSTKPYGSGVSKYVSNSYLELNAINWCLRQAAVNGINAY